MTPARCAVVRPARPAPAGLRTPPAAAAAAHRYALPRYVAAAELWSPPGPLGSFPLAAQCMVPSPPPVHRAAPYGDGYPPEYLEGAHDDPDRVAADELRFTPADVDLPRLALGENFPDPYADAALDAARAIAQDLGREVFSAGMTGGSPQSADRLADPPTPDAARACSSPTGATPTIPLAERWGDRPWPPPPGAPRPRGEALPPWAVLGSAAPGGARAPGQGARSRTPPRRRHHHHHHHHHHDERGVRRLRREAARAAAGPPSTPHSPLRAADTDGGMLATFYVPRGMTWQDAIVAHADIICLARRGTRRGRDEPARLLRVFRLVRATQRLRMENLVTVAARPGVSDTDPDSPSD